MKLSKTLMINSKLMPTGKKAFTLAEVLITLSILGVVAALTIPSLVNRNQDVVALTKMKKAVAVYEAAVQNAMVETNRSDGALLMRDTVTDAQGTNLCTNAGKYFKIVAQRTGANCLFTTSDGVYWSFNPARGYAIAYDSETNPRYGVYLFNSDGRVNDTFAMQAAVNARGDDIVRAQYRPTQPGTATDGTTRMLAPAYGYFTSREIMSLASRGKTKRDDGTTYSTVAALTQQIVKSAEEKAAENEAADQANQGGN